MFDGMKMTNPAEDCPPLYPPDMKFRKFGETLFRKVMKDMPEGDKDDTEKFINATKELLMGVMEDLPEEAKEDVAKDDNFYWHAFEMGDPLIFIMPGPLTEKAYWEIKLENGTPDAYSYTNIEGVAELFHNV
jgi:hypothetical protein